MRRGAAVGLAACVAGGCGAEGAGARAGARGAERDTSGAAASAAAPAAAGAPAIACADDDLARTCTATGLFPGAPATRVTFATTGNVPDTLAVTVAPPGRPPLRLPAFYGSQLWGQCNLTTDARDVPRLDRLAATDVDGDGRDDLVVLAECMTGIGPTGARPFPAGAVYLDDGRGAFRSDARVDSALTDLAGARCAGGCDVRALAREAVRLVGGQR